MTTSKLAIRYDWESVDSSVRAPELRSTWARLEIWVGEDCVTLSQDRQSEAVRRSATVALYPLAEWVAYNWWLLNFNVRAQSTSALQTVQSLRAAGDGFCWPDLAFLPVGGAMGLRWQARQPLPTDPARFVSSGHAWAPSDQVLYELSALVDAVIEQLDASEVGHTPLHEEWERVRSSSGEELEFCEATARLGLDPYSDGVDFADVIDSLYAGFDRRLVDDFLDAATVGHLADGIEWMDRALHRMPDVVGAVPEVGLAEFRRVIRRTVGSNPQPLPWLDGYRAARAVREMLGISPEEALPSEVLPVTARKLKGAEPALLALGETADDGVSLVMARHLKRYDQRFAHARALFAGVGELGGNHFLLTSAPSSTQQSARAFAAELLAPAQGIAEMLYAAGGVATPELVSVIADHYDAAPIAVQHQIDNQVAA